MPGFIKMSLAALFFLFSVSHASAELPTSGPTRADLEPVQERWNKICGHDPQTNKEVCYTTRDFGIASSKAVEPVMAMAVYSTAGEVNKKVRFLVPQGLMLKAGLRFSIDRGDQQKAPFEICFPNGCFAEGVVGPSLLESLKTGKTLQVVGKNAVNQTVVFNLPLKEFKEAYEGKPLTPEEIEALSKKLAPPSSDQNSRRSSGGRVN